MIFFTIFDLTVIGIYCVISPYTGASVTSTAPTSVLTPCVRQMAVLMTTPAR